MSKLATCPASVEPRPLRSLVSGPKSGRAISTSRPYSVSAPKLTLRRQSMVRGRVVGASARIVAGTKLIETISLTRTHSGRSRGPRVRRS